MQQLDKKRSVRKIFKRSAAKTALFLFSMISCLTLSATTFTVNSALDAHAATPLTSPLTAGGVICLRSALEHIDAIGGTHTINFAAALNGIPQVLTLKMITFGSQPQNVTITGSGTTNTIIRMSSVVAQQDRIFYVNPSGTTNNVILSVSNMTFEDGYTTTNNFGGAAICVGGGLGNATTVTNCVFDNNISPLGRGTGGAINAVISGDLTVTNSTFTNNVSNDADGGAIYFLIFNGANQGGPGVDIAYHGNLVVTNSTFTGNIANNPTASNINGGAIAVSGQGSPVAGQTYSVNIRENTFTNNTVDGAGGAISANNSFNTPITSFRINYNRFIGNDAASTPSTDAVHVAGSIGSADITNNWWGCNTGPAAAPCNTGAVITPGGGSVNNFSPYLQLRTTAFPNPICNTPAGLGNTSLVTTSFLLNSATQPIAASDIDPLTGAGFPALPVTWTLNPVVIGALSGQQGTIQSNGTATATFTANATGGTQQIHTDVDDIAANDVPSTASLVVNTIPEITDPPNQTKCEFTTTTFTTTVTKGTPAPTFIWFKGVTAIANGPTGNGSTYSGATTNSLVITNTQMADAGTYHVEATNHCGTDISANFTLTVEPVPNILGVAADPSICNNGTASITVTNPNGVGGTYNRSGSYPAGVTHTAATNQTGIAYGPVFTDVLTNANATMQTVQYTFTPIAGPTLNCPGTPVVVNVTVDPNPTITCPANTTVNVAPGTCTQVVNGLAPTPNCPANCGPCTITYASTGATILTGSNDISGQTFNKGVTTVTYTIVDANNNSAICSFTVTVNDNIPPVATCPANQTINTNPGVCTGTYTILDPYSDNCPGGSWGATFAGNANGNPAAIGPIPDGNNSSPISFQKGTTTVTITSTDASANTATCTFTVTVVDNQAPTLFCPGAAVTVNTAAGVCTFTGTLADPITDNCPGSTWSASFSGNPNGNPANFGPIADGTNGPARTFQKGTTTVTFTGQDAAGNPAVSCSYDIIVIDNQAPTLACPANQTINAGIGVCTGTYTIADPITDNCPGSTWSASFSGNANGNPANIGPIADGTGSGPITFQGGTTIVTITGVDASGNPAVQCSFTVTINDNQPPVVICPPNQVLVATPGVCTGTYTILDPMSDNCTGGTWGATFSGNVNGNPAPIGPFPDGTDAPPVAFFKGTTTVTITANDANGNSANCTFTVTFNDLIVPTLVCPANQTLNTAAGLCTANYTIIDPITDNCPGATWSANFSGNVNGNPGNIGPIPDGSDATVTFQKGTTTVTVSGVDGSGNPAVICTFTVTVIDNQAPTFACPANATQSTNGGTCTFTTAVTPDPITDNCPGATWSASYSGNPNGNPAGFGPIADGVAGPGRTFQKGTTTITYTGIDAAGNAATPCVWTITVVDNELPVVTCPANQALVTPAGVCTADYTILDPLSDNCPGATWSAAFSGNANGNPAGFGPIADGSNGPSRTFQKGTTTVTITAVDAGGTPATQCTFTVTVLDTQNPTIVCPANQTLPAAAGVCTATYIIIDPISDNCPGSVWGATFSGNPLGNPANLTNIPDGTNSPPVIFQKGTTTVLLSGGDASGNIAVTCTFTVTVNDTQAPVLTCPANQTIPTAAGLCTATYTINDPLFDNCPLATWSVSFSGNPNGNPVNAGPIPDGSNLGPITFQKGTTTVTLTGVDLSGNPAVPCTFTVTVNDTQLPTLTCPANQTLTAAPGVCTATYIISDPITDNCPGSTWGATFSGNPNGNPAAIGPIADGSTSAAITFQKGTTTVTLTGIDASGNNAVQCTFTVTVNDGQLPTLICPANQVLSTAPGSCNGTYVIPDPISDNCPGATWSASFSGNPNGNPAAIGPIPDGSNSAPVTFQNGITTVTITGVDASGNVAVPCTFTVTFIDLTPPVLTCPANVVLPTAPGICTADYTILDPISDNCVGATWSAAFSGNPNGNPANFGPIADGTNGPTRTFQKGTTTVTLTGVDAAGNPAAPCTFTITVNDTQPPSITCVGNQNVVTNTAGCKYLVSNTAWDAIVSDNCPGVTKAYVLTGATTGTGTTLNGVTFNAGTTTVTWTATDASGNTSTCFFVVTVTPTTGIILVASNQTICVGQNGNMSVNLIGTPPFQGVFSIFNNTTSSSTTYSWTSNVVGGPQNIPIPAANIPNTTNTPITYTISWISLTDATGCVGQLQGSANITVNPAPALVISRSPSTATVCPGTSIVYTVSATPGNTVPATYNYAITASPAAAGFPQSGTNVAYGALPAVTMPPCPYNGTITFTATPFATQAPNCPGPTVQDIVTVQDITPPVAGTSGSGTFDRCDAAGIAAARAFVPSATNSNCGGGVIAGTVLVAEAYTPTCGYTAPYGAGKTGTLVTVYRVTEPCGAFTDITKTITITDATAPVITSAPGNLNRTVNYCDNAALAAAQALVPTFTDGCAYGAGPAAVVPAKSAGVFAVGACPTQGTITNTFTVTDPCGNTSTTYTQTITIIDNTGPLFTPVVIPPQTLNLGGAGCQATMPNYVTSLPISATDCAGPGGLFPPSPAIAYNAGGGPNSMTQSPAPGTTIIGAGGGFIPVTVTATDACGNQSTTTFNVTLVDNTPPSVTCQNLNNTTINTATSRVILDASGNATINFTGTVSQVDASSSDPCSAVTLSFAPIVPAVGGAATPTRSFVCNQIPVGQQTAIIPVTVWAYDASGNFATCVSQVTIVDNRAPVFSICPANGAVSIIRDAGCIGTVPNYLAQAGTLFNANDECSLPNVNAAGPVTYTQSPLPGSLIAAGTPTVTITITATDSHTNTSTCVFVVNLVDNTPPSFGVSCPANQTVSAAGASCSQVVNWTVPTATDNCNPANGFPITYGVTPSGTTTLPDLSNVSYRTPGTAVTATFFVGTTTVTYTATDNSGNVATCVFTVTVTDNTPPVITCPTIVTGNNGNTQPFVTNVAITVENPFPPPAGPIAFTAKQIDAAAGQCSFTFGPTFTMWNATATDNCLLAVPPLTFAVRRPNAPGDGSAANPGVVVLTGTSLAGQTLQRGLNEIIWTATDFSGNFSRCVTYIIVNDAQPPVFNGPNVGGCVNNITIAANNAGCTATVPNTIGAQGTGVNVTDNCGVTLFEWDVSGATPVASGTLGAPLSGTATNGTWGMPNNFVFSLGVSNVQYRIRDAQNNIVTCIFTVTVVNNVTGTISGTSTAGQNASTTSTITFTGSGSGAPAGTQQYRFFYSLSTNGGAYVAQGFVTTAIGSNVTTVAQSNAALGTFAYRLDQVQDLTTGCMSAAGLNLVATITVIVGTDLTPVFSSYQSLSFPATGSSNNFGMNVVNIGAAPSSGQMIVRIPKTSGFTITLPNVATLSGNPVNNNNWTLNTADPFFWILTSNVGVVIPPSGSNTAGLTVTRNAGVAANTTQPMSATLQNGSGGDATPLNNTTTVQLTAQ